VSGTRASVLELPFEQRLSEGKPGVGTGTGVGAGEGTGRGPGPGARRSAILDFVGRGERDGPRSHGAAVDSATCSSSQAGGSRRPVLPPGSPLRRFPPPRLICALCSRPLRSLGPCPRCREPVFRLKALHGNELPRWPDTVPGLGAQRVCPERAPCAGCGQATWVVYGTVRLCLVCAVAPRVGGS
jgi:hypothetical protein